MLLNENQRVAQLLDLVWCAARLFHVLLNENQLVAQLLDLFWSAARLFHVLLNENQRVAQLLDLFLVCCQAVSCVVKSESTCSLTSAGVLPGCFMCC